MITTTNFSAITTMARLGVGTRRLCGENNAVHSEVAIHIGMTVSTTKSTMPTPGAGCAMTTRTRKAGSRPPGTAIVAISFCRVLHRFCAQNSAMQTTQPATGSTMPPRSMPPISSAFGHLRAWVIWSLLLADAARPLLDFLRVGEAKPRSQLVVGEPSPRGKSPSDSRCQQLP